MKKIKKAPIKKARKRTTFKEDVGKLLLDFGKLVFGGIIIGGILRGEVRHDTLIIGGVVAVVVLSIIGLIMVKKERNGEDPPTTLPHNSPTKKE